MTAYGGNGFSFATGGNGLDLAPSSGTTTFAGPLNNLLTIGSTSVATANVTGTGGIAVNFTGLGYLSIFGTDTYTGGVRLVGGGVQLNSATSLGATNTLAVDGGFLRGGGATLPSSSFVLNSDLVYAGGTLTQNGPVSGAGGVVVRNGALLQTQTLTLGGALTYAGATTIQNALPRASGSPPAQGTLTLAGTALPKHEFRRGRREQRHAGADGEQRGREPRRRPRGRRRAADDYRLAAVVRGRHGGDVQRDLRRPTRSTAWALSPSPRRPTPRP